MHITTVSKTSLLITPRTGICSIHSIALYFYLYIQETNSRFKAIVTLTKISFMHFKSGNHYLGSEQWSQKRTGKGTVETSIEKITAPLKLLF